MKALDGIDRHILLVLQRDAKISNVELSKKVGLSPTPCLDRVKRLEREGYILEYRASLNPKLLDASLLVFVEVHLKKVGSDTFQTFQNAALTMEQLLECHLINSRFDYLLKLRVRNLDEYRSILKEQLLKLPHVCDLHSNIVIEEVRETNQLIIYEEVDVP